MQYSQEHLKTMVYAEFGGQTECIMGNWKIENAAVDMSPFYSRPQRNWRQCLRKISRVKQCDSLEIGVPVVLHTGKFI